MTSTQQPSGDQPSSAEHTYALLLKLREQGSAPDFEAWVREYPEFERELRALEESWIDIEDSLERVLAPSVHVPSEPLVPSLAPGLAVGEFRLVRRIGVGGMGVVWLARQPALDRDVALKFVRPDRETAQSAQLFAREARAAGRARDRRIATVYGVGESAGHRWLAQEYVPGSRSLLHWLRELQDAGLPPGHERRAAEFVADVAEALHVAHELGVVHRDVKPQNLLIGPDGGPKVTDFGLARLLDEAALSETLAIRGTVEYMSPEQVTGTTGDIDRRSDVFSLGVVLYELLTLERPFRGATTLEVIAAISMREALPPRALRPGLAPELDVIALKALEKQPGARYPTALDLARDLRRWLANEPIAARRPGPWRRFVKWMRRHPTASVLLAAGGVVASLLLVGVWIVRGARAEVVEREKWTCLLQAHMDIDDGRLGDAERQVEAFGRLDGDDPEAHLVLAMGYARYLRFAEAQLELERARGLGFRPELGPDPTPRQIYLRALWLIAQRDVRLRPEAAELFSRAVALDERMDQVWLPLYQVRKSMGDVPRAREALLASIGTLKGRDDFMGVVQATLAELDRDYDGALQRLSVLRDRVGESRANELRLQRQLGRNAFLAYESDRPARPHLLQLAEEELRGAVRAAADDANAWSVLGQVLQHRANDEPADAGRRRDLRDEADACALRAIATPGGERSGALLRAGVAFDRLWDGFDLTEAGAVERIEKEAEFSAFEVRIADLLAVEPDNPNLPLMQSYAHFFRGAFAELDGQVAEARAEWARGVETSPLQFFARVKLGQACYFTEEFTRGLDCLREAQAIWDEPAPYYAGIDRSAERKWLFATTVWVFGMADLAEEVELAFDARGRALRELARDDRGAGPQEMISLAEFLATPRHAELRDCGEAQDLVDRFDLRSLARQSSDAKSILAKIDAACE